MDFKLLPQTTVVGRIANPLSVQTSRYGTKYARVLVYLYHEGNAKLMPMVAYNKTAEYLVKVAQQGDLLRFIDRIDPIRNHSFLNPTLIINEFSFLEPKTIRDIYHGKRGKQLSVLFPIVPDNYILAKHAHQWNTAKPEKPEKHVKVLIGTVEKQIHKKKQKKDKNKTASTHAKDYGGTWVDDAYNLSKIKFPGLHDGI